MGEKPTVEHAAALRPSGSRTELVWMRPHDHIGWAFDGPEDFALMTEPFLREGLDLGERILLVVDDPTEAAYRNLTDSLGRDVLKVVRVADVYGPCVVDAARQRAAFAATLSRALADGYTGIRVAADNSSLIDSPQRLDAWIRWEFVADQFMSENNVTGLCAFDRSRVDVDALRHLATLHPLSSASEPVPQFRLFVDGNGLRLEGEVDEIAIDLLHRALDAVPKSIPGVLDLSQAHVRGARAMAALQNLSASGATLAV